MLCLVRSKKGTQCSSWKTSREDQEIIVLDVFHSTNILRLQKHIVISAAGALNWRQYHCIAPS